MKSLILKILGIVLIFSAFSMVVACSDDDDDNDPVIVINDVMVIYNRDTGVFHAINKNTGELTDVGSIIFEGQPLTGLRDVVYNPNNGTVYASSNANDPADGKIFSIDPNTLTATIINSNSTEAWYAIPSIEMNNNLILGTVYWDEYDNDNNLDYNTGLIWLNLDGTVNNEVPFMYEGDNYDICCGMGLEYGSNSNEIYVSYEQEILVSDLNGNISEIISLNPVGFPNDRMNAEGQGGSYLGYIRCLEKDANGILYGVDENGAFGTINLELETFNFIAYLTTGFEDDDNWMALSMIPENIFPEE